MVGPWMVTGEVSWDPKKPDPNKKLPIRVHIKSEEYVGTYEGTPKFRTDYIVLVAFGEIAQAMTKLRKGDRVVALGRPQAGRPYTRYKGTSKETIAADLELVVSSWDLISGAWDGLEEETAQEQPTYEETDPPDDIFST